MGLSFTHLVVVLVVVFVIFGAGKLPNVMGDLGKGIRNFKAGLNGDPAPHEGEVAKKDDSEPKQLP